MGVGAAAIVSAAGNIAGGMAAQAIMGTPKTYGADTTIPGITAATIKKGGKGTPAETVPQVDASQALSWFRDAADSQEKNYKQGLQFYATALTAAAEQVKQGFRESNRTLAPVAAASLEALNEQMRMMGLNPMPATAGYDQRLGEIGVQSPELQKALMEANTIQDPNEREIAKQNILSQFKAEQERLTSDIAKQREELGGAPTLQKISADDEKVRKAIATDEMRHLMTPELARNAKSLRGLDWGAYEAAGGSVKGFLEEYNQRVEEAQDDYQKKSDAINASDLSAQEKVKALQALSNEFNANYKKEFDKGYTGEQVSEKIKSTPGYQFQFDQGAQAIERIGAAKGMLGSGNTLTALTQYGQDMGKTYFSNYMANLASISAQGSGAIAQISANQSNQGAMLSSLTEAGGQAAMNTYRGIGDAQATSLYNQGKLYSDTAQFNARLQMEGIQNGLNRQSNTQQQAIASGPGYINAMTNANQVSGYGAGLGQYYARQAYGGWPGSSQFSAPNTSQFGLRV